MDTYKLTDSSGDVISIFEARHHGEATDLANKIDDNEGISDTTLWIQMTSGSWAAI